MFSLIVTGTPCSGPSGSPRRRAPSARSAAARAASASTTVTAFSLGLTASSRARTDRVASRLEIFPVRMPLARGPASQRQRSVSIDAPPRSGRLRFDGESRCIVPPRGASALWLPPHVEEHTPPERALFAAVELGDLRRSILRLNAAVRLH